MLRRADTQDFGRRILSRAVGLSRQIARAHPLLRHGTGEWRCNPCKPAHHAGAVDRVVEPAEAIERQWYEQVYRGRGDSMRQLTWRAVIMGSVLGGVLSPYLGKRLRDLSRADVGFQAPRSRPMFSLSAVEALVLHYSTGRTSATLTTSPGGATTRRSTCAPGPRAAASGSRSATPSGSACSTTTTRPAGRLRPHPAPHRAVA